jgi:hypothetical protein
MKKGLLVFLTILLVITALYTRGWSEDGSHNYEYHIYDLFLARPLGILAGIAGTGVFIVTLPFTLPAGGVKESFNMFIVEPFWFSFVREFPDEELD